MVKHCFMSDISIILIDEYRFEIKIKNICFKCYLSVKSQNLFQILC